MKSEHESLTHAQRAALGDTAGDHARVGQAVTPTQESASDRRPRIVVWPDALAALTWAAGYDRIERGNYEAQAWFEVLQGLPFADVKAAITEHYRRSTYPVMPANIIQIIEEGAS